MGAVGSMGAVEGSMGAIVGSMRAIVGSIIGLMVALVGSMEGAVVGSMGSSRERIIGLTGAVVIRSMGDTDDRSALAGIYVYLHAISIILHDVEHSSRCHVCPGDHIPYFRMKLYTKMA